jgi:hypothetical protein
MARMIPNVNELLITLPISMRMEAELCARRDNMSVDDLVVLAIAEKLEKLHCEAALQPAQR